MNGINALLEGKRDNSFGIEVRLNRTFAFADQVSFVRLEAMKTEAVLLRVHRDRPEPEFRSSPEDTDSDLAAIERQQFFHHGLG
jgi:hypothetical protein